MCMLSQVAANSLTASTFSLFLPGWSKQLHAPISRLQLALALMVLLAAAISPLVGSLADKYPARWLFSGGLLTMGAFYLAISMASAAWQILALYGLLAPVALSLSTAIPCNALISRWFVRRLGLALGFSAFGIGLAGVLLPPLIAWILPVSGWRVIWRSGALLLALVVVPLVLLVMRNRPTERDGVYYLSRDGDGTNTRQTAAHGGESGQFGWRAVVARRNFWLLLAMFLSIMGLRGGLVQNVAPYAVSRGLGQQSAGLLLSVLSLSQVVSTLVLGMLSDRFGNRRPFTGLAVIMLIGAALVCFGQGLPLIIVGCVFLGTGGGSLTLLAAGIAAEFGPQGFGRAFGLGMMLLPLIALAPFFVARMQENTGSYVPALMGLALLVAIAGALSLLLRDQRDGPPTTHRTQDDLERAA